MSQLIITTDVSSIRPVFTEGTAENIRRYNQLKKLFENSKEYKVFAEPIPAGGDKVAWHTEYEGKIIPFRKLDEEDQETAKGLLKSEVNKLYKTIISIIDEDKNRKKLFDLIDSCIEIPDFDDIYIVQNASGQKNFCIVRWGFINEDFNSAKNLIANLIPLKVATISFRAIKGNNKIAVNEKIFFTYDGKTQELTTDDKGRIHLVDVKLLTTISAYQLDKNEAKLFEQQYVIENDFEHTFFIGNQSRPKQSVSIQTMDDNDNILPNITLKIQYDDVEFVTDSNLQGIIELGDLFTETKVICTQLKNEEIIKNLSFEVLQGKSIYFVNIVKQKSKGTVKIRVIDEEYASIPFAEVQVKFQDGTEKYFNADENGEFSIDDMPFKEDVIFRQIINGLPQFQQIIRFSDEQRTFEFKGKKIKTPLDYTKLYVTILNQNEEPIPNLKVQIENGVKGYNQFTDSNGVAIFDKMDCSKKITAIVENKGKKKTEEIKCQGQETKHTIKLGRKIGLWWLWLLLALIIIALGIIFIPKINFNKAPITIDSTTTVIDTTQIIPAEQKGMKFTVVNQNNEPLSNAKIVITLGDSTITKQANSKGEILFETLTDTTLTATANISAPGYTNQLLTFRVTKNKTIRLSNESVEISEIALPCGTQIESQGYHSTIKTFNMKQTSGRFKLMFNMFDIADKLIIYKGPAGNISNDKIIWQTNNYVRQLHNEYIDFESNDSLITVEIKGGDTTKTAWYFKVYCPQ
ncbi:MAG: hypothetical protein JXL97_06520 [Bacteroidales bacterium]|nr:hypothetical protein [Bacteroidales bacterium]